MHRQYTYLALGDSYTVGEGVPVHQSFPYQTTQLLRKAGMSFSAPEVLAKTGWTAEELLSVIKKYKFLSEYDFVTLLIGVNNQYRNKEVIGYTMHLEALIRKANDLAGKKKNRLILLNIPDYSVTPYAEKMDREKVRKELDVFNSVIKAVSLQYKVPLLNISESTRKAEKDMKLLASDQLHPSAKEYSKWAKKLSRIFQDTLKKNPH